MDGSREGLKGSGGEARMNSNYTVDAQTDGWGGLTMGECAERREGLQGGCKRSFVKSGS